jgi:hypothetical protein
MSADSGDELLHVAYDTVRMLRIVARTMPRSSNGDKQALLRIADTLETATGTFDLDWNGIFDGSEEDHAWTEEDATLVSGQSEAMVTSLAYGAISGSLLPLGVQMAQLSDTAKRTSS